MPRNKISFPIILPSNKIFTGLELKDWVWYNTINKTKYTPAAKQLKNCFNLDNDKHYKLTYDGNFVSVVESGKGDL